MLAYPAVPQQMAPARQRNLPVFKTLSVTIPLPAQTLPTGGSFFAYINLSICRWNLDFTHVVYIARLSDQTSWPKAFWNNATAEIHL